MYYKIAYLEMSQKGCTVYNKSERIQRRALMGSELSPQMHLIDYLRNELHLTGAKAVCREGGCGACTVVATAPDPEDPGKSKTFSVNACRQLLFACDGWEVETVEHLGDRHNGYHPLQEALASFYGTQCGYCSTGMVMTMHGQQKARSSLTMSQVETALDGNLCRCTGYRPILDAFKALAEDASEDLKDRLPDLEDTHKEKGCCKSKSKCQRSCGASCENINGAKKKDVGGLTEETQWYQPASIQSIYDVINSMAEGETYQLVVGNTGEGVYRNSSTPSACISTAGVRELYAIQKTATSLMLGGSVSLGRAMEVFKDVQFAEGFHYLESLASHWSVVANTATRNVGSIAGNLMLKHQHPEFPSDIFLTLLGAGASLTLGTAADASTSEVTLEQFLSTNMAGCIILSVTLPQLSLNTQIHSYKISPRAVNAHAYVNAVFRFEVNTMADFQITSKPLILYGGIDPDFIHAKQTEEFLAGRSLLQPGLVVEAASVLSLELHPDSQPQDASPQYRSSLAQALLYKAVLSILGEAVSPALASAGSLITRPVSSGKQFFEENVEMLPVGKPVPKVESLPQVSGEALFMNDAPALPGELHGVFIQSGVGRASIKAIDTSKAVEAEGVVAVVTAADIPGINSFIAANDVHPEEVFASVEVKYAGQPLGLVVATSHDAARAAASLVVVEYENQQVPVLTIQQAQAEGWVYPAQQEPLTQGDIEEGFAASTHIITGEFDLGGQHHMTLEPISARVEPTEDGYDVLGTTIWPTECQATVAQVLGVDASSVNVSVRRIGGSFGGKISRSHVVSSAAAVAAWKTHQPVKVSLDLKTHMTLVGGREPYYSKYKVGTDAEGKVLAIEEELTCDSGCVGNDVASGIGAAFMSSVYYCPNWLVRAMYAITNTASNTFTRAPGIVESLATMEVIMDHIAAVLGKDPLQVREINLADAGALRPGFTPVVRNVFKEDILPRLRVTADFDKRRAEVAVYNKANRWRKRGVALVPFCFNIGFDVAFRFGGLVNIYSHDGTVAITHGGVDMGQGINTKVSQIAAYILGVPLETVRVKPTCTTSNANSSHQGATICSDIVCLGVKKACETLAGRIAEFKATLPDVGAGVSWPELLKLCVSGDVDISERFWTQQGKYPANYDVYGGACVEVELDVLTGTFLIHRVDVIEDCGQSMSPLVDVGQVEGGLVMGLGLHTTEEIKFDPTTGQKLTAGTWSYKPLSALDIPVDLRVTLLPNSSNESGVLRAKAVGEPPLCLSYGVVMALRQAITAARSLAGESGWFDISTPLTVEKIQQLCLVDSSQFVTTQE
ncbi:uncharacterized protein LOC135090214 isoform X1 [Scylla paramamosain]|uniref:uncharacterized protein LOC135090214 isoform X1 n=1 Tax=Scylla paramamosain TaxID=85552 RepID=UPI0030836DC0